MYLKTETLIQTEFKTFGKFCKFIYRRECKKIPHIFHKIKEWCVCKAIKLSAGKLGYHFL